MPPRPRAHTRARHPLTFRRPLPSLSRPISPHPVNQPRPDVQKANRPTDCRLPAPFSRNTRLRGRRDAGIYMRGTEQKNGREFVLGRRGTSVAQREGMRERVRGIPVPRAERVAVYRRGRIIGDSLFFLAYPSHIPFQFTRPIYRLCSIDYPRLRSIFLRPFIHLSSRLVLDRSRQGNLRKSIEVEQL